MRFRSTGSSYIASGVTVRWSVWWPHPGDKGPLWLMAHPIEGEDAQLVTESVRKVTACEIGELMINGPITYGCGDPPSPI